MPYDVSWDCPHTPGPEEHWQESDCLWYYDDDTGVGGFYRVGQRPNMKTSQISFFAFARDGERFVHTGEAHNPKLHGGAYPMGPEDRWETGHRANGFEAGSLGDGRQYFKWDKPETAANLIFSDDFYTPHNWPSKSDDWMDNLNPDGHLEVGGMLRGEIRIGKKTYNINAMAHRDRSWGARNNAKTQMHRYRMFSGTCGPKLSFATFHMDIEGAGLMVSGLVVRDGKVHEVADQRVFMTVDRDNISTTGSTVFLTLKNGEVLRFTCKTVQGFLTPVPEAATPWIADNISIVECEGLKGFCDMEIGVNPGRGSYKPTQDDVTLLAVDEGLSKFIPYPEL